jgi:hypothetical protein
MNENIDLTKILKDCPRGAAFYSAVGGKVNFEHISEDPDYPIVTNDNNYTKEGYEYKDKGECVLFPSKEQRDWSKFVPTWEQKKPKVKVTIHPFDRMLIRKNVKMKWQGTIIVKAPDVRFSSPVLIPYNEITAPLLDTNNDCPIDYEIEFSKEYKE